MSENKICQSCQETFESRNKLFKHFAICPAKVTREESKSDELGDNADGFIYVTGGRFRGKTLGSVERFNLKSRAWENCPSLLENRGSHGAAAVGQQIFVCGGGGFKSNLATCEVFDMVSQTWRLLPPMATYRHALAVVPLQAVFKVFNTGVPVASCADEAISASSTLAEAGDSTEQAPTKRICLGEPQVSKWAVCAVGGWIDGSVCSGHLEMFDVQSQEWRFGAAMSVPRRLLGAAAHQGQLYVFGGNCDDGIWYTAAVEAYNPETDTWRRLSDLPFAGPACAISVGPVILVLLHGRRVYAYNSATDSYRPLAALPLPEWFGFDVTVQGGVVYAHGGATKGSWSKALFAYHYSEDRWEALPEMSTCRRRCAAALVTC